jgi:curved DNA-binding protein CbpA
VRHDATAAELRLAYRRLALDAHPDRQVDGAPADVMAAINEAWTVLGNPARRAEYDRTLAAGSAPPPLPPHRTHAPDPAPPPAAEPEPVWVDHTRDLRTFRWILTFLLILGSTLFLLVLLFIIFPGTS